MITETDEAWVLHQQPAGDSSSRVTFLTCDKGLLQCYYKGGRTPKKQAIIQPFLPLWLAFDVRRDWHYVRHVETLAGALEFKGKSLFAGLYLNELLYYTLSVGESQPALFATYVFTLNALAATTDLLAIEVLLRRFELVLLEVCGYSISFTEEAYSHQLIVANQFYQFIADTGFVLAEKGITGKAILAIGEGQFDGIEVIKTAKLILRKAIEHLLGGRELKSRSLFIGM